VTVISAAKNWSLERRFEARRAPNRDRRPTAGVGFLARGQRTLFSETAGSQKSCKFPSPSGFRGCVRHRATLSIETNVSKLHQATIVLLLLLLLLLLRTRREANFVKRHCDKRPTNHVWAENCDDDGKLESHGFVVSMKRTRTGSYRERRSEHVLERARAAQKLVDHDALSINNRSADGEGLGQRVHARLPGSIPHPATDAQPSSEVYTVGYKLRGEMRTWQRRRASSATVYKNTRPHVA